MRRRRRARIWALRGTESGLMAALLFLAPQLAAQPASCGSNINTRGSQFRTAETCQIGAPGARRAGDPTARGVARGGVACFFSCAN